MLIWAVDENSVSAFDLHKFGPIGLLLILTVTLATFVAPGTFSTVLGDPGISPLGTVVITIHDCAGNPVVNAVVQLQGLSRSQWIYTAPNGVATLVAPVGNYAVQGGYATFPFNQTINLGTAGFTATETLGAGCSIVGIVIQPISQLAAAHQSKVSR
jgi:hypothetical protein